MFISANLKRPVKSILDRVSQMRRPDKGEGEMTETGRFATRPWTPADDEILRSLALRGVDARAIGSQLNRTAVAVRSRARRLNILLKKTTLKRYQMG